jgi:hypothetical protein
MATLRNNIDLFNIDMEMMGVPFNRKSISSVLGGNIQATWVEPDPKKYTHGLSLLFLNYKFNPNAPREPGQNGLLIFRKTTIDKARWHVFVCQETNKWLFMGVYNLKKMEPLSPGEWQMQSDVVGTTVMIPE